jgi:hypothetical protein
MEHKNHLRDNSFACETRDRKSLERAQRNRSLKGKGNGRRTFVARRAPRTSKHVQMLAAAALGRD